MPPKCKFTKEAIIAACLGAVLLFLRQMKRQ